MSDPLDGVPELLALADQLVAVQRLRAKPPGVVDWFVSEKDDDVLLRIEQVLAIQFWHKLDDIKEAMGR